MATEKNGGASAETAEDSNAKREIAERIAALVQEKTGKKIGVAGGKAIFDESVRMFFASAVKEGMFRFPGGYGSFHVRHLQEGSKPKRLPSGQTTNIGPGRVKLRYVEGAEVKGLLGTRKPKASTSETATVSS